jgi:imidazolonepropionase-like amidohydrolase
MHRFFLLLCFLAPFTACAGEVLAIRGATVIDGTGKPPIPNATVLIDRGRFTAVGPAAEVRIPAGATEWDATGKFIMPGLVDLHTHPPAPLTEKMKVLHTYLYFGVTTIRSIGVDGPEMFDVRAGQQAGKILAPRIFTAGYGFAHPQGWPTGAPVNRPKTAAEARQMVRALAAKKADFVKMWVDSKDGRLPKIDPEICAAVIDEAHKHGIPAVAHIFEYADTVRLVEMGIDEFLHMVRDREELPTDFVQLVKRRKIRFGPTMSKMEGDFYFMNRRDDPVLSDPEYIAVAGRKLVDLLRSTGQPRGETIAPEVLALRQKDFAIAKKLTKQLWDSGVPIELASDGGVPPVAHGHGTHVELRILNDAGLSPLDAIRAATRNGAERLSRGKPEFGTIVPGMFADLIVLNADPLEEIRNSRKIDRVMQAGQWLDRTKLLMQ